MRPDAERDVAAVAPVEVEVVGVREHGRVAVRGAEQQQHPVAGRDLGARDLGVARGGAAEPGDGRVEPQRLLDDVVHERRIGQDGGAVRRLDGQVPERGADAEGGVLEPGDEQEEAEVADSSSR